MTTQALRRLEALALRLAAEAPAPLPAGHTTRVDNAMLVAIRQELAARGIDWGQPQRAWRLEQQAAKAGK